MGTACSDQGPSPGYLCLQSLGKLRMGWESDCLHLVRSGQPWADSSVGRGAVIWVFSQWNRVVGGGRGREVRHCDLEVCLAWVPRVPTKLMRCPELCRTKSCRGFGGTGLWLFLDFLLPLGEQPRLHHSQDQDGSLGMPVNAGTSFKTGGPDSVSVAGGCAVHHVLSSHRSWDPM